MPYLQYYQLYRDHMSPHIVNLQYDITAQLYVDIASLTQTKSDDGLI